ncbi:MAG: hypothetical protein LUQ69_09395, partial [Methanoregulaceae archaeon]|nr:hypothetical protein [Methanoregulaceae archaeon]
MNIAVYIFSKMKQISRIFLVLFLCQTIPAQPAGRTSYDAPPFQSDIWKQADAIDGLACQHLHWEAWKERYAKGRSACSSSCARLEAEGLVPCIGMQLWRN